MKISKVLPSTSRQFSTGTAWRQTFLDERRARLTNELSGALGDRKAAIEAALRDEVWLVKDLERNVHNEWKAVQTFKETVPHYKNQGEYHPPVRVAVTGAAGGIGYATIFRIASGQMLGPLQPVILHLIELPQAKAALDGVIMELQDCAFPLLAGVVATDDVLKGFEGVDFALLIGAKPRSKGMDRADLLKENAAIFKVQGEALNKVSNKESVRVTVVGNPANTNAWIAAHFAPDIDPRQFSAMTRLDHNRALAQLALKTGVPVSQIDRFCIWGNHSNTMVPDVSHTQIGGKWAKDLCDQKWLDGTFTTTVQNRGAEIIKARGASSCASAANACIEHTRDWVLGTNGKWTSMAVMSDGSHGAEPGIYYSYPVVCDDGKYTVVQNVPIDPATATKMEASNKELIGEKQAVMAHLGIKPRTMKDIYAKWKQDFESKGIIYNSFPPAF